MQGIPSSQNIGYMVPAQDNKTFFEDLTDGNLDGFPTLEFICNTWKTPIFEKNTPCLQIQPGSGKSSYPWFVRWWYQPEDVILSIDDSPIANMEQ